MLRHEDAIKLQEKLASKVVTRDRIKRVRRVCAVDVSYKDNDANAAAVVMDARTLQVLEHVVSSSRVKIAYMPGLMMLRESGPVLSALRLLKRNFDILLVDGNGRLHPRKCGLACYLGITLNKPTIGIAKSLLCGEVVEDNVKLDGKILGKIIERKKVKRSL